MYQTGEYSSAALGRSQRFAYYMPERRSDSPDRFPLLILLHGINGDYRDWFEKTRLLRYLKDLELMVVCPDGGNGWYTNAIGDGERREDDMVLDLVPYLQKSFPILSPGKAWGVGGLSMGGYGAIKLALKHPGIFSFALSLSGALEITSRKAANPVFGDPQNDHSFRKQENLFWLAEQALCRMPSERPRLILACGESDPLIDENRHFSDHLNFLGYGHKYQEMPGFHTWPYWNRAMRTFLPEIALAI